MTKKSETNKSFSDLNNTTDCNEETTIETNITILESESIAFSAHNTHTEHEASSSFIQLKNNKRNAVISRSIASKQKEILKNYIEKLDMDYVDVFFKTPRVSVYRYRNEKWTETHCEGSLYFYARSSSPNHRILILNKKKQGDLQFNADNCFFEIFENFIIVDEGKDDVYGIWFFFKNNLDLFKKFLTLINLKKNSIE